MRLLVTGATGFIGLHLIKAARLDGHQVFILTRSKSIICNQLGLPQNNIIEFNLQSEEEIDLKEYHLDAIIHLAFSTTGTRVVQEKTAINGTKKICEIAKRSDIEKVVLVSSMSVLDYTALPQWSTIDEHSPVLKNRFKSGNYAYLKAQQESIVKEALKIGMTGYCIVRAGLVYDNRFIINAHGGLKFGPVKIQISHSGCVPVVEVGYLCKVLLEAAGSDRANGEVVHLLDRHLPDQKQYIEEFGKRNLPGFGKLKLPWNIAFWLINICWLLAPILYRSKIVPDALRPNGFAARFKPFSFDTEKANTIFDTKSTSSFASC